LPKTLRLNYIRNTGLRLLAIYSEDICKLHLKCVAYLVEQIVNVSSPSCFISWVSQQLQFITF